MTDPDRAALPRLVATQRLGLLDELGVPYTCSGASAADAWASVSAGDATRTVHWFQGHGEVARGWSVASLRLWGHVAPDSVVAVLVASLPGEWIRETPIVDQAAETRSWIWRSSEGGTIFPFDPDELLVNLRAERYLHMSGSRRRVLHAVARRSYYTLRPLIPRRFQIGMRRSFSRIQAKAYFPRWPVEPTLHDLTELVLQRVADSAGVAVPYVSAWPKGRTWALVLTHDVETSEGRDAIEAVREVEAAAGYRSSWNLVPRRYRVDPALVDHLKAVGCEVGVHGLRHDGRDLASRRILKRRLPEIRWWADRWGAVGFRSPATHRVWEWMPRLGFAYDTSYPDTDPYEPMAGGCCCWLPFFNDGMVELPITLPQDHTVFVILRSDASLWLEKVQMLRARGGMALALTHPDYMLGPGRIDQYGQLLDAFRDDSDVWNPLPQEVAEWWRRRAATSLRPVEGRWQADGPAREEISIAFVEPEARANGSLLSRSR